jgi:antitoxin Phd
VTKRDVRWSLQDAKAQFSEVVRRALDAGPQVVTRNGEDAVVILSVREFNRLSRPRAAGSLARFLSESPLADVNLEISRPRSSGRSIKV